MKDKRRRGWGTALCAVLFAVLAICSYMARPNANLLPAGFRYGLYTDFFAAQARGKTYFVDKSAPVASGDLVAYDEGTADADRVIGFGRLSFDEQGKPYVVRGGTLYEISDTRMRGKALYQVDWIGPLREALMAVRYVLWGALGAATLASLYALATARRRRMMRERRELIHTFELYGEKYDLEEAGIDY